MFKKLFGKDKNRPGGAPGAGGGDGSMPTWDTAPPPADGGAGADPTPPSTPSKRGKRDASGGDQGVDQPVWGTPDGVEAGEADQPVEATDATGPAITLFGWFEDSARFEKLRTFAEELASPERAEREGVRAIGHADDAIVQVILEPETREALGVQIGDTARSWLAELQGVVGRNLSAGEYAGVQFEDGEEVVQLTWADVEAPDGPGSRALRRGAERQPKVVESRTPAEPASS